MITTPTQFRTALSRARNVRKARATRVFDTIPVRMATTKQVETIEARAKTVTKAAAHLIAERSGMILFEQPTRPGELGGPPIVGMAWLETRDPFPRITHYTVNHWDGRVWVEDWFRSPDSVAMLEAITGQKLPQHEVAEMQRVGTMRLNTLPRNSLQRRLNAMAYSIHGLIRRHGIDYFAPAEEVAK